MKNIFTSLGFLLLLSIQVFSQSLTVATDGTGNYKTIQSAINASKSGYIITVKTGTYTENIVLKKGVMLLGENNPTINGNSKGSVVKMADSSAIKGFTIVSSGSSTATNDAGVYISDVKYCWVVMNVIYTNNLYGVYIKNSTAYITHNYIGNNTNQGVYVDATTKYHICFNIIANHKLSGISINAKDASGNIYNNDFYNNSYGVSSSLTLTAALETEIYNNIFYGSKNALNCPTVFAKKIEYNNFFSNQNNYWDITSSKKAVLSTTNTFVDPQFVNVVGLDFTLRNTSPCIQTGLYGADLGSTFSEARSVKNKKVKTANVLINDTTGKKYVARLEGIGKSSISNETFGSYCFISSNDGVNFIAEGFHDNIKQYGHFVMTGTKVDCKDSLKIKFESGTIYVGKDGSDFPEDMTTSYTGTMSIGKLKAGGSFKAGKLFPYFDFEQSSVYNFDKIIIKNNLSKTDIVDKVVVDNTKNVVKVDTSESTQLEGIPFLKAEVVLIEPSGNKILDAEENASLEVKIFNSGTASAQNVKMTVKATPDIGFTYDKIGQMNTVKAGEYQTSVINLVADKTLDDGEISFDISFTEQRGFPAAPIKLTISTEKFKAPKLQFVEAGITEMQGNSNNIIENGELIKVAALIQNKGQGKAESVVATIKIDDTNIIAVQTSTYPLSQSFDTLAAGEARIITFLFSVNWNYTGSDVLPISITLSESRSEYGGDFPSGLSMKTQNLATQDVKLEGIHSEDIEIEDVSLSIDVDANIPDNDNINSNRYALIIGNENYSEYQKGLTTTSDVEYALRDAQYFKKYAEKLFGIPASNIIELYDGQKYQMERDITAFMRLAQLADGEAELYVFYAGHGFPDESTKEAYIMPVDIGGTDVTNGIKLSDFYQTLTSVPCKKVTVFLDACFSGGGRSEGLVPARSGIRISTNETTLSGNLVVFTSSTGDQISLPYSDKQHGMFTYFLLKSLQDSKGDITYGDLADMIISKVQTSSITINKNEQNPQINISPDVEEIWETWTIK
jgi:uncharacterized caspase-like protein